jgi:hypothetical protein
VLVAAVAKSDRHAGIQDLDRVRRCAERSKVTRERHGVILAKFVQQAPLRVGGSTLAAAA